jgi:hypothetical protein
MNIPHATANNNFRCLSHDSLPLYWHFTTLVMLHVQLFLKDGFRLPPQSRRELLGSYASSANLLLMTQDNPSVPSLGVKNSKDKMGPICCPETLVRNYHYVLHGNRGERSSQLLLRVRSSGCHHINP